MDVRVITLRYQEGAQGFSEQARCLKINDTEKFSGLGSCFSGCLIKCGTENGGDGDVTGRRGDVSGDHAQAVRRDAEEEGQDESSGRVLRAEREKPQARDQVAVAEAAAAAQARPSASRDS